MGAALSVFAAQQQRWDAASTAPLWADLQRGALVLGVQPMPRLELAAGVLPLPVLIDVVAYNKSHVIPTQ